VTMPRISPPTITASAIWAYGTRTLTGLTGTPRIDLTGADEALTPSRIWAAPTRELTQAQFPFWSAIITQAQQDVSVPAGAPSIAYVDITPAAGETWLLFINAVMTGRGHDQFVDYWDFDGAARRRHTSEHQAAGYTQKYMQVAACAKVLTDSLYGSVRLGNYDPGAAHPGNVGYSGFKLSQPLVTLKPLNDPPEWLRKPSSKAIPAELEALEKYICDAFEDGEYKQVLMLEHDTPLATDEKGNIVARQTTLVPTKWFATNLAAIKADPEKTGYKKYLDKWADEGISL